MWVWKKCTFCAENNFEKEKASSSKFSTGPRVPFGATQNWVKRSQVHFWDWLVYNSPQFAAFPDQNTKDIFMNLTLMFSFWQWCPKWTTDSSEKCNLICGRGFDGIGLGLGWVGYIRVWWGKEHVTAREKNHFAFQNCVHNWCCVLSTLALVFICFHRTLCAMCGIFWRVNKWD